jgi:hypothetical protein
MEHFKKNFVDKSTSSKKVTPNDVFPPNFDHFDARTKIEMLNIVLNVYQTIITVGPIDRDTVLNYITSRYNSKIVPPALSWR